jgi:hypothetical protein
LNFNNSSSIARTLLLLEAILRNTPIYRAIIIVLATGAGGPTECTWSLSRLAYRQTALAVSMLVGAFSGVAHRFIPFIRIRSPYVVTFNTSVITWSKHQ